MRRGGGNSRLVSEYALCVTLAAALLSTSATGRAAGSHDLRVVIDISGSMKQTDPHNLRVPALRLLTELLPPETKAGVWTFGQQVNMLVAHDVVTPQWKDAARTEAAKINSVALFTDIGQALQRATRGWDDAAQDERRSLVLLTDGKVDIDKDAAVNAKARRRILEERLPALIKAGVTLYPVGLSDDVDHELLQTLARKTGGLYQVARTADDLQRIFLNILEQSTQANTLPIVAGGFQVDASIDELNVVVFHKEDAGGVALRDPEGTDMTGSAKPAGVRWFDEQRYTVVTVPKPQPGQWHIVTDPNPENRVFVVSRLHVVPDPLPESLFAGEEIAVRARVMDGDNPVQDSGFLKLLKTHAAVEYPDASPVLWPMQAADDAGRFEGTARLEERSGVVSISYMVEGPTFDRSVRRLVTLVPAPITARWIGPSWVGKAGSMKVGVDAQGIASDRATVSVLWEGPETARHGAEMRVTAGGTRSVLFAPDRAGSYRVSVTGSAVAADGRSFLVHLSPIAFEAVPEPPPPQAEPPPPAPVMVPKPPPAPPKAETGGRWWPVLGAVNLLLALAALYYAVRTRRRDSLAMERRVEALTAGEPDVSQQELQPEPDASVNS